MERQISIVILCEPPTIEAAKELHSFFQEKDLNSEILIQDAFPIAHAMINFLQKSSKNFDLAFLVIANNSREYFWISQELGRQHLMAELP